MRNFNFLYLISFCFFSCSVFAQTSSITEISCKVCDSLYKRMCPDDHSLIFFGGPERLPEFCGGDKKMMAFLTNNIHYPQECVEERIEGRVVVQFIVTEEGKIVCARICRSLHPALDKEALRIINLMPDWQPASNFGVPVKFCYTLPILFKLDSKDLKKKEKKSKNAI